MKENIKPLVLDLPPSVNAMLQPRFGSKGRMYTLETRNWFDYAQLMVTSWMRKYEVEMYNDYVFADMIFYLKHRGQDNHNFFKATIDSFQKAGLVRNDSLVMPRTQEVWIDKENPRVVISFKSWVPEINSKK